jgi:hypothetical protein
MKKDGACASGTLQVAPAGPRGQFALAPFLVVWIDSLRAKVHTALVSFPAGMVPGDERQCE